MTIRQFLEWLKTYISSTGGDAKIMLYTHDAKGNPIYKEISEVYSLKNDETGERSLLCM